ncbi:hypothetical protein [Mesoplasma corruscae]|uniref:DUF177 domain-containing protein n=1 Tax=Mesoplasma corruscae TaxID=216874 RepID=A0A2S5RGC2_9MOLU|nr:hypothetical protein [Mesoplasma corruscae]PPE06262.1 hypothetical protein MCORR_v1c05670 [Mesoplasma corruscae]
MDINYFENNLHTEIIKEIKTLEDFKIFHPSVTKLSKFEIDVDLDWSKSLSILSVNGIINFSLLFVNEFTNKEEEYSNSIDWSEEYCFSSNASSNSNIILGDRFNVLNYAIEQININLPYNLSNNNNDIIKKVCSNDVFFTEEEYNKNEQNKLDPRWNQLDQFNKKK